MILISFAVFVIVVICEDGGVFTIAGVFVYLFHADDFLSEFNYTRGFAMQMGSVWQRSYFSK